MDVRKELGKKIQLLRLDKGLSRQAICQDEEVLTTRQLQRIEKGESIPNAQTALYLARQLGVTVDDLLDERVYFLPQAYKELKYQLCHQDHYGDGEKVADRESLLEEIYDQYFDMLPEEEQLTIQLFQASMDVIVSQNADFDQGLVDEHLPAALSRQRLTFNDLLVMKLAMTQQAVLGRFNMAQIDEMKQKVLKAVEYVPTEDLRAVQDFCIGLMGLYCYLHHFVDLDKMISVLEKIMEKRQNYHDKIFVYYYYWKIELFVHAHRTEAEKHYQSALLLCDMLNQDVVKEKLLQDWQEDMATLEQDKLI